jgi:hypothetical protein
MQNNSNNNNLFNIGSNQSTPPIDNSFLSNSKNKIISQCEEYNKMKSQNPQLTMREYLDQEKKSKQTSGLSM